MTKSSKGGPPATKLDRKTVEKNRRIHMKSLCSKLVSLVPPSHFKISKDLLSQQNQLSYVIAYINELKERVDQLEKKKQALGIERESDDANPRASATTVASTLPVVELRDFGNIIEVMLISGRNERSFMLYQVIGVVEEEGGDVVSLSISTLGDKIIHSLHVEAKISRVGVETSRVQKRLQKLVGQEWSGSGKV